MKKFDLVINNKHYVVEIENIGYESAEVIVNGTEFQVNINRGLDKAEDSIPRIISHYEEDKDRMPKAQVTTPKGVDTSMMNVKAPMPGLILQVLVKVGDKINSSQPVIKMEAMKMENEVRSPGAGIVKEIHVNPQDNVAEGDLLITLGTE
jgi:biotin carboxyl carrier protein